MQKTSKDRKIEDIYHWVQQHVRPDFGWDGTENDSKVDEDISIGDRWEYFLHRVRVGFKLIWKF